MDDFKIRDIEFQKLRTLFAEKEVEFENLKNILNKEQSEKENIINEKENIVSSYALRLQQVEEEKDKLLIDTEKLKEEFDASKQNMEGKTWLLLLLLLLKKIIIKCTSIT